MDKTVSVQKERLWSKYFIILFGAGLFSGFCLQCYNSVKAIYITDVGGATSFVGILSIVGLVCTTLMRLLSGRMSDAMSKRKVVLIGLAIYAVSMLCHGFFPNLKLLILFQILQSVGYSMSATALSVLVVDVLPKSRMSEGLGYFGLSNSLSSALGPTVALAIMKGAGFEILFVSLAAYLVLSGVFVALCRYEKDPEMLRIRKQELENQEPAKEEAEETAAPQYKGILKFIEPSAIPCTIVSALYCLPMGFTIQYLTLYATEMGIESVGLFFTFSAVMMVVARLFFGRVADKYGTITVIAPAIILYAAAFVLILIAPGAPAFVIWAAGALYGLAGGMLNPVLNAIVIRQVPHHRRGAASGTFMLSFDIGIAGGGAIWGFTIQYLGYGVTIGTCIALCAVALAFSFVFLNKRRLGEKN